MSTSLERAPQSNKHPPPLFENPKLNERPTKVNTVVFILQNEKIFFYFIISIKCALSGLRQLKAL